MIKSIHGVTKEPFRHDCPELLSQHKQILDTIKIHSQQNHRSGEEQLGLDFADQIPF